MGMAQNKLILTLKDDYEGTKELSVINLQGSMQKWCNIEIKFGMSESDNDCGVKISVRDKYYTIKMKRHNRTYD